ncbi:MAG: hypothetical protein EOM20_09645 [Spartobacteria bacterium]|nr:hypothetical protein [Spartobacteria bacterium]
MDTSYLSRVRRLEQLAGSLTDQESRALLQLIHYDAKRLNLAEPESNALQIAASLGDTSAVHTARQLLARDGDIQLRMSALAVLGLQGDVSDRDILRRYEQSSDIRLRNAAVAAAKKIYRKTDNTKEESS